MENIVCSIDPFSSITLADLVTFKSDSIPFSEDYDIVYLLIIH